MQGSRNRNQNPADLLRGAVLIALILAQMFAAGCGKEVENPRLEEIPARMLWAWERPEDLRFLDPEKAGVAFLAQTITLDGEDVLVRSRRQPLEVRKGTYLMAVTRIETSKERGHRPGLTAEQIRRSVGLVSRTANLPGVRSLQVDFDAVVSERGFYRRLLENLRARIDSEMPLSITALASWCVGDLWFRDLPVDEVVPMAFEMGADENRIRKFLENGNDWNEPNCRTSYGLVAGDPLKASVDGSRRIYYFKTAAWEKNDLERIID